MDPESIEAQMTRYQQGDFAAATALVHALSPRLHRYFLVQVVSRRDADDLLQETWLRLHQVRHTYRAGEPVLPWMYAIARHVRVDHYRRARRAMRSEQSLNHALEIPHRADPPARAPDMEALLAALPESQREVVAMLKVADMSLEEVARATSSSVGSVKLKAHRAYARLREIFGQAGLGTARGRENR